MNQIQQITSDPKQKQRFVLPDKTTFTMSIEYKPLQSGWFITELSYDQFTAKGLRIVTSPNMLHQYKNLIPFGLMVLTRDGLDPTLQQDFSSGYATFYLLNETETKAYEDYLSGQV
jgi:hypothetical protein